MRKKALFSVEVNRMTCSREEAARINKPTLYYELNVKSRTGIRTNDGEFTFPDVIHEKVKLREAISLLVAMLRSKTGLM